MAALHGKSGLVKVGANTVASIKKWSIDRGRDENDITAFGDAALPNRSFIMGLVGATGNLEGDLNAGDANGQIALINSMESDTALTLQLYINATDYIEVSAFITNWSGEVPIDDLQTTSFDFRVTGAPDFTNFTP